LYKTQTGKYHLGPIWDFDWAFSYEKAIVRFFTPNNAPFWSSQSAGTRFFSRFTTDPRIKTLLKQRWSEFRDTKMPELLTYIDDYALTIEGARQRDFQKWQRGNVNFKGDITKLKTWLQGRANFLTGYINNL
jgi:CotH kinase protein